MTILDILQQAVNEKASDIFVIAGLPLTYKKNGRIIREESERLLPDMTQAYIQEIYEMADHRDMHTLYDTGDDDFSFALPSVSRFRVNTYRQRGSLAAVIRVITFDIPHPEDLHIPQNVINLGETKNGLILVTGPAGSGKSTTLACIIDYINSNKYDHIITLEDPLEYLHTHKKSIVSQREIYTDTDSYVTALKASLRQSPDVILLGEMRDYETVEIAMTAAETGHLIISTLHTLGAANSIDRIIDVFPPEQQRQIAVQIAMTLRAVVSQQLVPTVNGDLIPVFEIMTINPAIRTMIRDNKMHQIDGVISTSPDANMQSMDNSLLDLYKKGTITKETALNFASHPDVLGRKL